MRQIELSSEKHGRFSSPKGCVSRQSDIPVFSISTDSALFSGHQKIRFRVTSLAQVLTDSALSSASHPHSQVSPDPMHAWKILFRIASKTRILFKCRMAVYCWGQANGTVAFCSVMTTTEIQIPSPRSYL